jgi:hypothetical protein
MRKILIIGNGPVTAQESLTLGEHDVVVRFNNPSKNSIGLYAGRTDYLFAANSKAVLLENFERGLLESVAISYGPTVVLPYHPKIIREYLPRRRHKFLKVFRKRCIDDGTLEAIKGFGEKGLSIALLSIGFYDHCCSVLGISEGEKRDKVPSTGFLAINHFMRHPLYKDYQIYICGFGWTGWHGHHWQGEREFAEKLVAEGKVRLLG